MGQNARKSQPSVSERRRERERAEMTERIMDVARKMFVRDGYEAVTLRKIANAIEYSPGTIYQYFRDKQALVTAIIQADSASLRGYLLECLTHEDPVARLAEMARRYAAWGMAHPNHYRLMLLPPGGWSKVETRDEEQETPLEREALHVLTVAVQEAIRRGLLKDKYSEPALVAATLWAGIHGVVLLEITTSKRDRALLGGKDTTFAARFDTLTEVFMDGFLRSDGKKERARTAPSKKRA